MLTSKDFELAAEKIQLMKAAGIDNNKEYCGTDIAVVVIADIFKASNPKFNKDKFYKACNLEP